MQSSRVLMAVATFEEGFNCAQAVLSAFGPDLGLEEDLAFRLAQSFGGGIAHRGETCGAVAGALMVLGLRFGKTKADDDAARDRTYAKVSEFYREFQDRHGSCCCRELIGYDLSVPDQYAKAKESGVFKNTCPGFVRDAALLLEDLL